MVIGGNCNNGIIAIGVSYVHAGWTSKKNVKGTSERTLGLNKFGSQGKAPEFQPSQCRSYGKHARYHLILWLSMEPAHRLVSWAWTCKDYYTPYR